MPDLALSLSFRDQIEDPAVIEEFDRTFAQLNAHLAGIGQIDAEAALQNGNDPGSGVQITSFADLSGPLVLPVRKVSLTTDINALDPGESTIVRVSPQAAVTVHGMSGGQDGRVVDIYVPDSATFAVTFADDSSSADADKRFQLIGASDLASVAGQARGFTFRYDGSDKTWVQIGGSSSIAAAAGVDDVDTTQTTVTNTTTETSVYSYVIPANTLTSGKILRAQIVGSVFNNASAGNFSAKVQLGSTVIASGVIQNIGAGSSTRGLIIDVTLTGSGASSQDAIVNARMSNTTSASWASPPADLIAYNTTLAEDSTTQLTLDFLVMLHTASVNLTYTNHGGWTRID